MDGKILIVDDEPDMLGVLEYTLKKYFYVRTATCGQMGVEMLQETPFDLVITDMKMPGLSGLDLLRQAKGLDQDIEVIVLTGYATLENAVALLKDDGAFDYLRKPLKSMDELLHAVRRALERRNLRLENKALLEDLERRVRERTDALEKSNKSLCQEIAERKIIEQKLLESQKKFKELCELLPETIYEMDTAGRLSFLNQNAYRQFGYEDSDFDKELNGLDMLVPEDRDRAAENMRRTLQRSKPRWNEYTALKKDGSTFPIMICSSAIIRDGDPVGLRGFIIDITERKQVEGELTAHRRSLEALVEERTASLRETNEYLRHEINDRIKTEKALRDSEARLSGILSAVNDHVSMIDEEHKIVWANDAAQKMFGPDLLGRKCHESYHSSDKPCDACVVEMTFSDCRRHDHETEVIGVDGEKKVFWCSTGVSAWYPDGRPKSVVEVSRDITAMKQSEEDLRNTKEQLSVLLESLPIVPYVCEAGGDYRITYLSAAVEEVSGFTPDRFTNEASFWVDHIHPDDRSPFLEERTQLLVVGKSCSEYRFRSADGSYKWFSDRRRIVRLPDGAVSHIVGTWQDISEEKRLRKEAEYRLQQLIQADKLASLGEVVAGVAHEINNPNSFITYNVPLLEETWEVFQPILQAYAETHPGWRQGKMSMDEWCDDMGEIIHSIRAGSNRINRVVENLKDFARMDQGGQTKPVQINEVIEKALTIVGAQLRKSVAKIEVSLAEDLPTIHGHFQKLEQVIANILVNAARAIPEKDQGRLSIRSRFLRNISAVSIEIEDNGVGIEPVVMDHLFDPFFTTRRNEGGTGLGLSVSYGLVEEHHGRIGILTRLGKGSRFTVFLPLEPDRKLRLQPTILCVDDDVGFLSELRTYFVEVKDTVVETISNPADVIAYLEEHPEVDIVLSDILMPGINGWELLDRVKTRFPLLPVILYSGDPQALRQGKDLLATADYLLQKPFKIKDLIEIIKKMGRQKL